MTDDKKHPGTEEVFKFTPAWPTAESGVVHQHFHPCPSLRHWFAGQALACIVRLDTDRDCDAVADVAYLLADAMMEAR